jgi:FlaA1/EpsC-like NDP-sugar epimerase
MKYGCDRFVLISTDKAVNPTNVMGATKRICEMVIQTFDYMVQNHTEELLPRFFTHDIAEESGSEGKVPNGSAHTEYVAVRFGNVLGSNGSVVPLFKKQIAEGGPVTVTDKNIIRYFMTIPEAVSLVLQASFYANGGEIFVLDMGEPVRIDDMARKMIELSGFTPDVDIEVKYTGLRPGEKLYEELLIDKSTMKRTANQKIFIEDPYPMDDELFLDQLRRLENASKSELERNKIIPIIREVVPTFIPDRDRL